MSAKVNSTLSLILLIGIFNVSVLLAQKSIPSSSSSNDPYPLFQSDELIKITLHFNIKELVKDIGEERENHDAILTYCDDTGQLVTIPVELRTRGNFRRNSMNCNFPPLRLKFSDSNTINTLFTKQDKLKLVTHCITRNKEYEQFILKEYLAYRIFNMLTEESYKVRLVYITYIDAKGKNEPINKYGFFIEPSSHMAARNGCQEYDVPNITQFGITNEAMIKVCLFQYMIGNTDWSVPYLHNITLIRMDSVHSPVPVPFDFDWCGLVNAKYAVPSPTLGISNIRERLYRGYCRPENDLVNAFQFFEGKKQEILDLCESFSYLDPNQHSYVLDYINDFYKILSNPDLVRLEFFEKCRNN